MNDPQQNPTWIDEIIMKAEEEGEFENLPGAGKPVPGAGTPTTSSGGSVRG
ncbi:MAG: DnaJ family domain-containing protein [Acidimicrobiia bacterium]